VIGKRLVPLLVESGHEVVGTTRSPEKVAGLRASGAEPAVVDLLDREAVTAAVRLARPEAVVHEATALAATSLTNMRKFDDEFAPTNRLRIEGTDHLLAAAHVAGAYRFVAQSFAGWPYAREGGPVKTEDDPLDPNPPKAMRRTLAAIRHLETVVVGAEGIEGVVLRYGGLYGPGTSLSTGEVTSTSIRSASAASRSSAAAAVSGRSSTSIAVSATLAAIERGTRGIYNIVDDEPAPVRGWLPVLANALGAKPPRHIPTWLARLIAGPAMVILGTQACSASNAKAKRELGRTPTIRHGATASRRPTRRSQSPTGRPPRMPWLSSA
jgi:nucleoside-diphosphate-sugar epimerase